MADKYSDYTKAQAEKIAQMLEQGTAPWVKPWDPSSTPQGASYNATTGKAYTGFNSAVLATEEVINGYTDPRWVTFNQAKSLGANVRKGEKGTQLVKWLERKDKDDKSEAQSADGVVKKPMVPMLFTVFNAEQIENMPEAPVREPIKEHVRHEQCEALLKDSGATIKHDGRNMAFYNVHADSIHLPKPEQFKSPDAYYATALHELGHWTGAKSRLDRDMTGRYGTEAYASEELRAEISSWMVSQRLGLPHNPEQHVAYVGSWIKAIRDDPKTLVNACRDAEKICDYIGVHKYEFEATKANEATNEAVVVHLSDRVKQAPVRQQEPEHEQAMGYGR